MAAWLRVLANPKILKRFLGTKAGKKAALKYGSMLLKSDMARRAIDRFMGKNGNAMRGNAEYKKLAREYTNLQKRVKKLEAEIDRAHDDRDAMQTKTFTLGRQVVEMQQLYAQMQMELQRMQQNQMMMAAAQQTR